MKNLFLLILLTSISLSASSQQYGWVDISGNVPTQTDLSDVYFVSDNEGWITSSFHAEIYHTTDGGETFEIQTTQYSCNAIYMINENEGYAGGENGRVYYSTDGGLNWPAIGSTGNPLLDLDFATASQGYACADHGTVYSVTPEGTTNLNCQSNSTLRGISAPSVNNVWVCGGNRIYYYNGTNFTSQSTPGGTFNDIHYLNNLEGWVVGNSGIIGHTEDGGTSWIGQTNPDTQNRSLYGVFFLDADLGWAVGLNGIILQTIDGGTTWEIVDDELTSVNLRSVQFTSPTNGYIVGNNRTLLKYTELSGIDDKQLGDLDFEVYPNPCKEKLTLRDLRLETRDLKLETRDLKLEIIDIKGRLMKSMELNGHENTIDVSDLPAGVYFVKLQVEEAVGVRKIIIQ